MPPLASNAACMVVHDFGYTRTLSLSGNDLRVWARVTAGEMSRCGYGDPLFIPLPELMNRDMYLALDEVVFRINYDVNIP